jgi:NADPH:quinone reductase-like Zn-dependent oxidoreductase
LHANPTVHEGSWAELIALTPEMQVAPKPASLDLATAGIAPLAGIAALAAVDALALSEGETILIVGATGGVGSFAVQLAARAGATIIAPALPEDADYLRELGITEHFDRDGDVVAAVRDRHLTASTHCSIWSPTRRERSTARSGTVRASPRRTAQPEKGRAAPT